MAKFLDNVRKILEKHVGNEQMYLHYQRNSLFRGADFPVRHGRMHVSSVALNIPIFANLYKKYAYPDAEHLTARDIEIMQYVALFHDYGRMVKGKDISADSSEMENIGYQACKQFLVENNIVASDQEAEKYSRTIIDKDKAGGVNLLTLLLHDADCLAVLRANDWQFDVKYLDFFNHFRGSENAMHDLQQVIVEQKKFLLALGDTYHPSSAEKYPSDYFPKMFAANAKPNLGGAGSFSLPKKAQYEKSEHCYQLMQKKLEQFPFLQQLQSYFDSDQVFYHKVENYQQYYRDAPKLDYDRQHDKDVAEFIDHNNYITNRDLVILVHQYKQKHQSDKAYDVDNIKVVTDLNDYKNLAKLLDKFSRNLANLPEGSNVKILFKFDDIAGGRDGKHVVPIYIRKHQGKMKAFMSDAAAGLNPSQLDKKCKITGLLEKYSDQVIKTSTLMQNDRKNCSVYAISAMRYFCKYGDRLFDEIEPHLVPDQAKISDQSKAKIHHLKADYLPAPLLKMSLFEQIDDMNRRGYGKMRKKVSHLTDPYHDNADVSAMHDKIVSKKRNLTLAKYWEEEKQERQSDRGRAYAFNNAANRKMLKMRSEIADFLEQNNIVTRQGTNLSKLEEFFMQEGADILSSDIVQNEVVRTSPSAPQSQVSVNPNTIKQQTQLQPQPQKDNRIPLYAAPVILVVGIMLESLLLGLAIAAIGAIGVFASKKLWDKNTKATLPDKKTEQSKAQDIDLEQSQTHRSNIKKAKFKAVSYENSRY